MEAIDSDERYEFEGKTYCFTGKMAELKRTQAEREVRARGGFTIDVISPQLDYLVIGSIPSPGWKYGDYGTKISLARQLRSQQIFRPLFISESQFMESLSLYPVIDEGELDEKIVVYKYTFHEGENSYDKSELEDLLELLQGQADTYVSRIVEEEYYLALLADVSTYQGTNKIICRIVKKVGIGENAQNIVDDITKGFEAIQGLDGKMKWYERAEGTASYVKLLKALPRYQKGAN